MTYLFFKRLFDISIGIFAVTISLPFLLIACIAIILETKGSPIFIQTRVGLNGKLFKIIKLRGMFSDSKIRFPELYDYSNKNDLNFNFHHSVDPRVTRVGNFIRKSSIDEFPNFFNVIVGSMSLVGPRPEIPEVIELYDVYKKDYLSVKPGITCLSKITGRDKLTKLETINQDLYYIKNKSFFLDFKIIIYTAFQVLIKKNVY